MKTKNSIKMIEVLESIRIDPYVGLNGKLDYVIEGLKREIETNEFRKARIIFTKNRNKEQLK